MAEEPVEDRRKPPSKPRRYIDRTLAVCVLVFSAAFFYQMTEVLKHHTCWCDFVEPAGVSEISFALFCGSSAVLSALGLNIGSLMRGIQASIHSRSAEHVEDE